MRATTAMGCLFCLALTSACVHGTEGIVRERAAAEFSCADYALHVEEVGPDVFRAEGCGQELIYACRPGRRARRPPPSADAESDDFSDKSDEVPMVCARRL